MIFFLFLLLFLPLPFLSRDRRGVQMRPLSTGEASRAARALNESGTSDSQHRALEGGRDTHCKMLLKQRPERLWIAGRKA